MGWGEQPCSHEKVVCESGRDAALLIAGCSIGGRVAHAGGKVQKRALR